MYCIYAGKKIDESKSNLEHVIPLSLGGSDEFCIKVSEKYNSILGSKIDGKMTQDFLIGIDRVKHGDKGHSSKEPRMDIKSKLESEKPVITSFTRDGLKVYDVSNKKYINIPNTISLNTKIDLNLRMKFTAKVALATGYYLFGEKFVKYSDCESLRKIMMSDNLEETIKKEMIKNVRFYDPLLTGNKIKGDLSFQIYKMFFECNGASSVVWTFSEHLFIVFVAIYGKFVGMVNFQANIEKFPKEEDFWLGHVLICQDGYLIRKSWREALIEMCEQTGLLDEQTLKQVKEFKG